MSKTIHFITYANDKYAKAKQRLVREAGEFGEFATIKGYGPEDLPDDFRKKFDKILKLPRGGGYWIWKTAIIKENMLKMREGDFLIYMDAGFYKLNEDKKNCWKRGGKGNLPIDGSTYEVKTDTLGNIINTSGFKYIDFCFIDVEGGELNVIKGMNWDIPIFMFIIEMTGSSSIPDYIEQIQAILKNKGYRLIHKAGYNDEFWMNPNYFRSHMFLNN